MYVTAPRSVVFVMSPDAPCVRGDRAELIARLEAERLPNGLAFTTDPTEAPEFDDSLPATEARREALEAALDAPSPGEHSPAGWDRRSALLRVVA